MKKYTWLLVAALFFVLVAPAFSAPLFGDVPDEHWARDAVANLAAKGLVEGYPDGTFKGDRAATRYEMAMVIARFLAKNDQEHATFATKADLEELRKLVMQLKDELDALGVRVTNLEENVSKLDKRVTELERITFYGEIDSMLVTQGFQNNGIRGAEIHVGSNSYLYQSYATQSAVVAATAGIGWAGNSSVGTSGFPAAVSTATNSYQQWGPNLTDAAGNFPATAIIPSRINTATLGFNSPNNVSIGSLANPSHMYNQMVGNQGGANLNPFYHGVFPVADYRTGRPLTNGTGFSVKATLGINAKINDEIDAGLELAAYTSMGDPVVNAFYGVSAPYLCNAFTANVMSTTGDPQSLSNQPWTRMVLDNFWVKHKTSGIKLIGGSFGETNADPLLYAGIPNPNVNGPEYLNNYGFRVFGTTHFLADMDWEVFATKLADQDPYRSVGTAFSTTPAYIAGAAFGHTSAYYGSDYNNWAYGLDFSWRFGGGNFKIGYLRAVNDYINSTSTTGGAIGTNGIYSYMGNGVNQIGPYGNAMTNPFQWVNPSGYYAMQLAGGNPAANGTVNDTSWINKSPIFTYASGTNLNTPNALINDGTMGGYGPQCTSNWNAKFAYKWDPSQLRFFIEYANSTWKPNMNSGYSKTGGAGRAGLGATLAQGKLDLDLTYKSADAYFDPMTFRYPTVGGVNQAMWRFPQMSYYPGMYQLHDSDTYPNNRQGWKFKVTYRFPDEKGKIWASYEGLEQKTTSVYDVRYYAGALSGRGALNWTPNSLVMGFTPGFIDPVFTPYAMGTYYQWNAVAPNTVSNWGRPLEDPKGKMENFSIGVDYKFPESGFIVDANYYNQHFKRGTGMVVNGVYNLGSGNWYSGPAASANNIDFNVQGFHIGLQYPFNERFTGRIGYDWANITGHYDPNNIYWLYAMTTGSSSFKNVDTQQSIPYLGFDYKINKNTEWGLNVQFYSTNDKIGSSLTPTRNVRSNASGIASTTWRDVNPFQWNGVQIMTEFKVKF